MTTTQDITSPMTPSERYATLSLAGIYALRMLGLFMILPVLSLFAKQLEGSTPADYVLPSGNSLATCLTFAILLDLHGIVNILIYSFRNRMYEVRSISKNQIEQEAK